MKTTLLSMFCLIAACAMAGNYEVSSPNGKVKVVVNTDEAVKWSVSYSGQTVLLPSVIDIQLRQGKKTLGLGQVGKVAKHQVESSFKKSPSRKHSCMRSSKTGPAGSKP